MKKRKTVFEQVPLAVARKIAAAELKRKESLRENVASKQKAGGSLIEKEVLANQGASL
jgi:hypothetical protein